MRFPIRPAALSIAVVLAALIVLAVPVTAVADCSAGNGYLSLVIVNWDASAYFWNSSVDTYSKQVWGAPWCYLNDQHKAYKLVSGAWSYKAGKTWQNWNSVDSGYHPGYARYWSYDGNGGSYKITYSATRYSSHNQLWGIAPQLGHYYDKHTTNAAGIMIY